MGRGPVAVAPVLDIGVVEGKEADLAEPRVSAFEKAVVSAF